MSINSFKKNFVIWVQPQNAVCCSHRLCVQKGQAMFRSLPTHMAELEKDKPDLTEDGVIE